MVRRPQPARQSRDTLGLVSALGEESVTATVGGTRQEAPSVPTGRIVLQPPPEITPAEGLSNTLMQAVPMLGSVGSMARSVSRSRSSPGGGIIIYLLATPSGGI